VRDKIFEGENKIDPSGNILNKDIGVFLKEKITEYFRKRNFPTSVKYIDPSYIIRSKPANANDSLFCLELGQNAVHAGFSGRTNMLVGYINHEYVHIPIPLVISKRKKVDQMGGLWQTVVSVTEYR